MRTRIAEALLVAALISAWATFRIVPAHSEVFSGGSVPVLLGNDPWFHLHHAAGAAEHFPRLLRWDVGAHFPSGSYATATGLFNLGVAALGLLLGGGEPSLALLAAILAWSPVVLGGLSLAFFHLLARELGGRSLAFAALALRVLLPGSELERTLLGFGDNHAAEICLATLALWLFARNWRRAGGGGEGNSGAEGGTTAARAWASTSLAALPFALFLYVWQGAPLHLAALLAAFWGAWGLALLSGRSDGSELSRHSPYFGALFVLSTLPGLLLPELVMTQAGFRFAAASLALQTALCFAGARCLPALRGERAPALRFSLLAAAGAAALGAVALSSPRLLEQVRNFLGPRNPFVAEHEPVDLAALWAEYGLVLPWIPLGFLAAFARPAHGALRPVALYLAAWTGLWILSTDFGYLAGALLPLAAAMGMLAFARRARQSCRALVRLLCFAPPMTVAATLALGLFAGGVRPPFVAPEEVEEMVLATEPWREAMDWLRTETPPPTITPTHRVDPWRRRRGFDYPEGAYGVLCHWQYGNLVTTLGSRIAVSARSRSGTFIEWFLEEDEAGSHRRLEALGEVRYLVLDAISSCDSFAVEAVQSGVDLENLLVEEGEVESAEGPIRIVSYGEIFRRSVGARLYLGRGDGMSRYRLVYESPQLSFVRYRLLPDIGAATLRSTLVSGNEEMEELLRLTEIGGSWAELEPEGLYFAYSGQLVPALRIFERVRGATVVLDGLEADEARVELVLESQAGRSFIYRQDAERDPSGRLAFTLPYPSFSSGEGARVRAVSRYRLVVPAGGAREFDLDEEAVRSGGILVIGFP